MVDQVGLNHLTWIRAVQVDGRDLLPDSWPCTATIRRRFGAPRRLLDELGAIPSYYLRYFYEHDVVLAGAADRCAARDDGGRDRT